MTENIDELAAAVAAKVIDALPRGRLPIMPEYLSADQVAQMTGFSPKWLEARRADRTGPPYIKIGHNVRYRTADVRAFMEAGEVAE